ncbi:MAG: M1 family aminopeptidase [Bacteroidales bacterium]|nr:hypothetical protein [Lentimicrobiaceae bacterium]MDG1136338.1 M1 family aminopeptidase [Bacteroidales bacterium]MDG1902712.1 M1 family aminopeptidase [Bacteroidales bacterium]MDG2081591.1 M1 family aminopeptidase [Bacteroidales bacterium]
MIKLTLFVFAVFMLQCNVIAEITASPGDSIDAIHYKINIDEINTSDQTIKGWTNIIMNPLVQELTQIKLDLKSLTVDSVFVNQFIRPYTYSNDKIVIDLSESISIGDTVNVKVYYHGHPFHEAWGGFHFSGDYAFNLGVGFESIPHNLGKTWFPCIDDFTDRATYDVIGTAETGLTITAGGRLLDTINNGNNTTTWHWNIPYQIPTYLASICIGDYVEYKDVHVGIEDSIPISIYTRPSSAGNVAGSFINLHEIIEFFETRFGPYPFEKIGYTGTAIGAMEHVSNIAYPNSAINGGTSSEYLYTHELSHMWFGNKVTCSTAEDMWLNEGWATFCAIYYKEVLYSHATFLDEMRTTHKDVLQNAHVIDGGYWAVSNIPQEVTYGKTAYDKGSTVVNTLKNYLGDSLFFDAMTAYMTNDTIAYSSRSSEELCDFLTAYTGIDMHSFFDAWVMSPGTPHFSIDSINVNEEGQEYIIDIWFKQKFKGFDFLANDNILEVTFIDENFILFTDTIHFSGKTGHSVKVYDKNTMPSEPILALMDLFEKTNDATTDNYSYFSEPMEYTFPSTYFTIYVDDLTDSAMIRATHSWVEPDSLVNPIEGLKLSPYRHWKIEGIFPESINASGKFFYSISSNLDNELITSTIDSIVILYRENAADEWKSVPQTRIGVWSVGNIIVDEILPGEYTLAVWDTQIVDIKDDRQINQISIYPNPTNGDINFEFARTGNYELKLFDNQGRILDSTIINSISGVWNLESKNYSGIHLVEIFEAGKLITSKKIIFTD